jgi:hypothetical protein
VRTSIELIQDSRRSWWWSPQPFWRYTDQNGLGWSSLVDIHPGMFNVVWKITGAGGPPASYASGFPAVQWAVLQAPQLSLGKVSLLDAAFRLSLPEFEAAGGCSLLLKGLAKRA